MSLTIASLLVVILGFLGVGEIVTEAEVAEGINLVVQLVGIIGVWYGRWRIGDVTVAGFRK